jgi:hypothetical protein
MACGTSGVLWVHGVQTCRLVSSHAVHGRTHAAGREAVCNWRISMHAAAIVSVAVLAAKMLGSTVVLQQLLACCYTKHTQAAADCCGTAPHHVCPEVVSVSVPLAAAAIPCLCHIKVGLSTCRQAGRQAGREAHGHINMQCNRDTHTHPAAQRLQQSNRTQQESHPNAAAHPAQLAPLSQLSARSSNHLPAYLL